MLPCPVCGARASTGGGCPCLVAMGLNESHEHRHHSAAEVHGVLSVLRRGFIALARDVEPRDDFDRGTSGHSIEVTAAAYNLTRIARLKSS